MKTKQHIGLLILRVSIAFTMLVYGISKLTFGIDYIKNLVNEYGLPSFISYGVFVGELIAPILIIIGYRTRLAALVFSINCFVAIVMDRISDLFSLNAHGGWAIGLIFIYLMFGIAMFFTGGGKYALSANNKWD